jgi:hypothetical protein
LALVFDRIVESLQQAAQDDHYSYDGSWFPWSAANQNYSRSADQLEAEDRQKIQTSQPGIMVYRRAPREDDDAPQTKEPYQQGLVVLLVAEQPTGGISDSQFDSALQWLHWLRGSDSKRPVRIVGPVFSGSLPSLQRELENALRSDPSLNNHGSALSFQVSSGTVSSYPSYQSFSKWLSTWHDEPDPSCRKEDCPPKFKTAMENDALVSYRFCKYLDAQGYSLDRVAELSEDETAFGNLGDGQGTALKASSCKTDPQKCRPALSLYYPRDIASMRSAYEEQSIFSSTATEPNGTNNGAPSSHLRGDLREPASSEHDTVRHYAGSLTSLAQESVLVDITNRLSEKQIQFIILRSTSSLDQIFLAEFLRRAYPEGRVVMDGADLLFTRGSWGQSLNGVMVLSPYPLLTMEAEWFSLLLAPSNGRTLNGRTFGEDISEGVYIAAREMFRDSEPSATEPSIPIPGYTPPPWARNPGGSQPRNDENEMPATWLTVISHRRLWPVAALNSFTLGVDPPSPSVEPHEMLPTSYARGDGDPLLPKDPRPQLRLSAPLVFLLMMCIVWSAAHLYFCWKGSPTGSPRARAYFAPLPDGQHPALIAFGGLLLASVATVVAVGSGCLEWIERRLSYQHLLTGFLLILWLVAVLAASIIGTWKNYKQPVLRAGKQPKRIIHVWRVRAAVAAAMAWLVFLLIQLGLGHGLSRANAVPTLWRDINLFSGVSRLLPQMLLIAGLYLWFWCTLRGLAHFGDDRPLLPSDKDLPALPGKTGTRETPMMHMFSREGVGEPVEQAAWPWRFDGFEALVKRFHQKLVAILAFKNEGSGPPAFPGRTSAGPPLRLDYFVILLVLVLPVILGCRLALDAFSVRTLGEHLYGVFIFSWICLCMEVVLADATQFWLTWSKLRQLLVHLDRLPLRRTLRALKGLSWGSIWKIGGNVLDERYRVLSLQVESLRHLRNEMIEWLGTVSQSDPQRAPAQGVFERIEACLADDGCLRKLAKWYVEIRTNDSDRGLKPLRDFQKEVAGIAGQLMTNILIPAWRLERESLIFESSKSNLSFGEDDGQDESEPKGRVPRHVRAAEEFFVLPYLAFIQNILGRLRTIALGSLWLFVATTLAISSYPFEPLDRLGGIFLTVFVIIGGVTIVVYSQMSRDATLSHITNTQPGRLGWDFWFKLAGFGIGPLIALLTTLFPSIADFVFSWLQPGAEALK